MEHLPLPEGEKHFIVAPYNAPPGEWYDHKGFLDFPKRRGWTSDQLPGGDTSEKRYLDGNGFKSKGTDSKVEEFFQTWLFFGLVIEVLKVGGVRAKTEDFLEVRDLTDPGEVEFLKLSTQGDIHKQRRIRIVNTSKLPCKLKEWRDGIQDKSQAWTVLNRMFERARQILDCFCTPDEERSLWENDKPPRWPVRQEISTTLIAMVFSLRSAAIKVCDPRGIGVMNPWLEARSEILARRLQRQWCLADATTIIKDLSIDGHYYIAASPGLHPDELDRHSKCVRQRCLEEFPTELYHPRHIAPWHKANCPTGQTISYGGQLGPERGQTGWDDAIARIIDKNAIPIALWVKGLRTLWSVEYHLSGKRTPSYVAISHVWADGMGNRAANWLPECQLDRITHLVENVRWEGRKPTPADPNLSDGVGFWMDTLCVPALDKDRKREAIKNMHHVYSNAKAVLVLDKFIQKIPSTAPVLDKVARLYLSNWIKRLWTHQEGFLPSLVYIQFADQPVELNALAEEFKAYNLEHLETSGKYLGFPFAANARLLDLYSALRDLMKQVQDEDKWMLYEPLAHHLSPRRSTRLADETVCMATIINIDPSKILAVPGAEDDELARDRMAVFLEQLGTFDMSLIFNNYERLDKTGYRWAPKSLLNFRTPRLVCPDESETVTLEKKNGRTGLPVRYPGLLVDFANKNVPFGALKHGCEVQCRVPAARGSSLDGESLVLQLPANDVRWAKRQYAVILSEIPKVGGKSCPAVVGLCNRPVNGIYWFEHLSLARIRAREEYVDESVDVQFLERDSAWFVM
ncbi:hypothetical protein Asppvi_004012 [Aspergillus pseudoviridinutans]|uniref:Heterokaryon incompatibility domain-containing protein n=1 Tax=Aspergillus pseudoviridinutans TaxID=1517512 RepID=A0A9P3B5J3_9EURO|nr:uncharacterized protein Asppvi_004012 [Aspergillus pseudoviridinutans]GIJ85156.1 hypothetical protein Asppvi_004012 [Aspergillus pseudoviridinutans]